MPYGALCEVIDLCVPRLQNSVGAITDAVLHLQSLRNAGARVQRLPPELLVRIFSYCVWTSREDRDLITVTHVCRQWRAIALNNATLWRTIFVTSLAKAEAFVQRSKRALLDVEYRGSIPVRDFMPLLSSVTKRLRSLIVEVDDTMTIGYIMGRFDIGPPPHLETLHLVGKIGSVSDRQFVKMIRGGMAVFLVHDNIFMPSLRSLRLSPICVPWQTDIYSRLSVLELGTPDMVPPSEQRLLEILRQCPGLETLRLDFRDQCLPLAPKDDPGWIVSLPLLATFSIRSLLPASIASLLSHLTLPPSTRYEIFTQDQQCADSVRRYHLFPDDCSRLAGLTDFRKVELVHSPEGTVAFRLYHRTIGGDTDPVMLLSVAVKNMHSAVEGVPSAMLKTADTFVIHSSEGHNDTAVDWTTLLYSAPCIRSLCLVRPHQDFSDVLRTLMRPGLDSSTDNDGPQDGSPPTWLCPELTDLLLVGVLLSGEDEGLLVRFARERLQTANSAFRRLEIAESSGLSSSCTEWLTELGVDVVVHPNDSGDDALL
ncbi:hypothetical protein C8Q79DRAFT_925264 [Trametes meyenii]|nr:hypothetical protein C8Q79DRAFT_925264 [Trametes meyenii]